MKVKPITEEELKEKRVIMEKEKELVSIEEENKARNVILEFIAAGRVDNAIAYACNSKLPDLLNCINIKYLEEYVGGVTPSSSIGHLEIALSLCERKKIVVDSRRIQDMRSWYINKRNDKNDREWTDEMVYG